MENINKKINIKDKRPRCPKCYTVKWCTKCSNCGHCCEKEKHVTIEQIEKNHQDRVNRIKSSDFYKH